MPDPDATATLAATTTTADAPRPLPDGWRWARLGDVCSVVMGQSPDGASYNADGRGVPLLNGPTEFGLAHPTAIQWTTDPTQYANQGDILLCVRGATTGRKNIADQPYCIGRGLAAIRGREDVAVTGFLWWVLDHVTYSLLAEAAGSTFPNLPGEKLKSVCIPLPPLAEQRRIAAVLAARMAAVERARAAALVEMEAAQALPAAELRAIFESEEAQAWPVVSVRAVSERIDYGYTASAVPAIREPLFLRITDIQDGGVDWHAVPGVTIASDVEKSYMLKHGDIVFARTGGTTGKSYLVVNPPRAVFASYLIRIRPAPSIDPRYLYLFFQSDGYWIQIHASARGGAQPNVNATLLGEICLPLPDLVQQQHIAAALDARMAEIARLRASLIAQLDAINALPAALLRQAFNGEL